MSSPADKGTLPLSGIRVIDFTRVLSGPYGTLILSDLGAEVIKIEAPQSGDSSRSNQPMVNGESHYFMALNRGKKSVVLDLATEEGREAALALCQDADIVLENFRPGVMDRLGLGPDVIAQRSPRTIYCSISGFGQDGPMREAPAYNEVIQATTGLMGLNGEAEGPPVKLSIPIGDLGGGVFAVIGILAALERRHRTGVGERIDVSLFDVSVSFLSYLAALYLTTGESPVRVGSGHHSVAPLGVYQATDGYIAVSVFTRKFWNNFCDAIGREDLKSDPRFKANALRVQNKKELDQIIGDAIGRDSVITWEDRLAKADVPHARVRSVGDVLESELASQREMVIPIEHPTAGTVRSVGSVIKFGSGGKLNTYMPAPTLGQHTAEVLASVGGYSSAAVKDLTDRGIVGNQDLSNVESS